VKGRIAVPLHQGQLDVDDLIVQTLAGAQAADVVTVDAVGAQGADLLAGEPYSENRVEKYYRNAFGNLN
jgi:hypothetical protein